MTFPLKPNPSSAWTLPSRGESYSVFNRVYPASLLPGEIYGAWHGQHSRATQHMPLDSRLGERLSRCAIMLSDLYSAYKTLRAREPPEARTAIENRIYCSSSKCEDRRLRLPLALEHFQLGWAGASPLLLPSTIISDGFSDRNTAAKRDCNPDCSLNRSATTHPAGFGHFAGW